MSSALTGLAGAWILWCALHSLLAWPPLVTACKRRLGRFTGASRMLYNLFALVSLTPVVWLFIQSGGPALLAWPDGLEPLLWAARGLSLWLMLAGARAYSMPEFLGFAQLQESHCAAPRRLATSGILGHIRHPWYLAALILLWCRDLAARDLVTAALLSGYLWLGTVFEERRLVMEFGAAYRHYQSAVPRFWLRLRRRR